MLAEQQQGELDRLKEELGATDQGISQLQQQAETEFETLVADRKAFEAVVSETLVRIGAEAVPVVSLPARHILARMPGSGPPTCWANWGRPPRRPFRPCKTL